MDTRSNFVVKGHVACNLALCVRAFYFSLRVMETEEREYHVRTPRSSHWETCFQRKTAKKKGAGTQNGPAKVISSQKTRLKQNVSPYTQRNLTNMKTMTKLTSLYTGMVMTLICNLQQFCSSDISPQSLSPSHFHCKDTHLWLLQVNSSGRQVGDVQFTCSSELSPQSLSRSHKNRLGMHRELLHKKRSAPQPSGVKAAGKKNLRH